MSVVSTANPALSNGESAGKIGGVMASAANDSPWLKGAAYDLCFFSFPWIPFLFLVVFGFEWRNGFGISENADNLLLITGFLFALNFAHRNYTYFVAYGDAGVFGTRKALFTVCPLVVFAAVIFIHYFHDAYFEEPLVAALGLWNVWHVIMQRHGLLRGYARRIKHGFEQPRHGSLDLALLWGMVLFTLALGTPLHLPVLESSDLARPTVDAVAPLFTAYPLALAAISGALLLAVGACWARAEWQQAVGFRQRLPRLVFLLSNAGLFGLCLYSPVLGIIAFGFSHSVEYIGYVHTVQKRKIETAQYRGLIAGFFWNHMLLGAGILTGIQGLTFYYGEDILGLELFAIGTGALHFFYDGFIWKKSKQINTWAI
jgi:hypothetical protein